MSEKIKALKDLYKEYELLAKYNGGQDYDRYCALEIAIDNMCEYQKLPDILTDALWDIYMSGVNMTGEYQGCWVRYKDIENILNEHFKNIIREK